jgi:signal transduction histidine kinase
MSPIMRARQKVAGFFRAPAFSEDFEKTRIARLLNTLVLQGILICFVALGVGVPFFFSHKFVSAGLVSFFLLLCLLSWLALRRRNLLVASAFLVVSVHLIVISNTLANGGIASKDNLFYAVPVVISPLLLPYPWALLSALVAAFELGTFAVLGWLGFQLPTFLPGVPLGVGFLGILILTLLYQAVRLSVQGWTRAIRLAEQELAERRRTEAERDKLREALFQAQKMESLGRMAGSVAHDFNNLLMVVTANLDQVKCLPNLDKNLKTDLAQTEDAVASACRLNRSLMDFSRKRELCLELLDVDRLVEEACPVLVQLLGKQVRLETFLSGGGTTIRADRTGMVQVLQNLAVNAREAMEDRGSVTLRTRVTTIEQGRQEASAGSYLQLSVRDTGCGMTQAMRERIFEPFFTTKTRGTGLGLATVFGVVKQHGGLIEVDSELGKGTEFRVFLPCA